MPPKRRLRQRRASVDPQYTVERLEQLALRDKADRRLRCQSAIIGSRESAKRLAQYHQQIEDEWDATGWETSFEELLVWSKTWGKSASQEDFEAPSVCVLAEPFNIGQTDGEMPERGWPSQLSGAEAQITPAAAWAEERDRDGAWANVHRAVERAMGPGQRRDMLDDQAREWRQLRQRWIAAQESMTFTDYTPRASSAYRELVE
ncbi:hypothetical protein DFH07DRAFT_953161 [Mycena maculata]|uniref:Uncharacterized protein n=1 Tax=Mycena maculata TaxID=230809 RepID=A0AAD7NSF4_9AGAR|nr:hypothetical protein DFH07DRAFT_953161 [Mycena maculata]